MTYCTAFTADGPCYRPTRNGYCAKHRPRAAPRRPLTVLVSLDVYEYVRRGQPSANRFVADLLARRIP